MRADPAVFVAKNQAKAKRPRFAIEVSFGSGVVCWLTSHVGTPVATGGVVIPGVLRGLSGTGQTLNPDTANATIGSISFQAVDLAGAITDTMNVQLAFGRSTRMQQVRVYAGYEGLDWSGFVLIQTQLITSIEYDNGVYDFRCMDIQREMRKYVFNPARTTLASSVSDSDTTINVYRTAAFEMCAHGTSYSDAPSSTVGYVQIEEEIIRYTGKTATTFTGCTRGVMNTVAVEHVVDPASDPDRATAVNEYIYLEMPAVKLAYALLTGVLYGQGGATLPTSWHLGIDTGFVYLADFISQLDLWDTTDDQRGRMVRFEGIGKTDGKQFIERELLLLCGSFMPVYTTGALGFKRMANVLAGAAYAVMLDESNVSQAGPLHHDFESLHNVISIQWNYETSEKAFTRKNGLIDADSVAIHQAAPTLEFKFRGLHGSIHSSTMLAKVFDTFRDRYTGPPLRIEVTVLHALNGIEVGDIVRVRLPLRDFVAGGTLDRSFEVQRVSIDWITGKVKLSLFASSQAPGAIPATSDEYVLSDAFYNTGTLLSSVLTITGSAPGHVSASGTITGNADITNAAAIFRYDGDLVIDQGVEIKGLDNVQLRIKGAVTNNGTITLAGNGKAGAAGQLPLGAEQPGTAGFLGVTEPGGGLHAVHMYSRSATSLLNVRSIRGAIAAGAYTTVPPLDIVWDGSSLTGIPTDLRGTSGGGGSAAVAGFGTASDAVIANVTKSASGGTGGASGGGLLIISRGFSQGSSGKINLSGADGVRGGSFEEVPASTFYAGSGAGGAPGALIILLDGALTSATDISANSVIAKYGSTPQPPARMSEPFVNAFYGFASSYYIGMGDGRDFALPDLSGLRGAVRVQYIPGEPGAVADDSVQVLKPPTNIGLASGTSELLSATDGTIIVRIKVTWTASLDARTVGYELQYKKSSDSIWHDFPLILGRTANTAWIPGVQDGVDYDVRIRAGGPVRQVSAWLSESNYPVIGKTAPPSNVGTLSYTDPVLSWPAITDVDRRGYIVKYQHSASTDWASALPAHDEGFITATQLDCSAISGEQITLLVRAIDTSGNLSTATASKYVDLRPPAPDVFTVTRQADGTREFFASTSSPPSDLEGAVIRWYLGSTSDWNAMEPLHEGVIKAFPFEINQLAAGTYTFAAKNRDWAGNESGSAIFISSILLGDPRIAGALEDVREEPNWTGTKTSCVVDTATGWLVATDTTTTWATSPATWAAFTSWLMSPAGSIQYVREFNNGSVSAFVPLVTVVADGSVTIEESHCDDGVSWSAYAATGTQLVAQYVRIRVTVTGALPIIKSERIVLSATPISEIVEDVDSSALTGSYRIGTGDVRIPIAETYTKIKGVAVTLQSVGAGYTVELIDKDTTVGPRIKIYDSGGSPADATFDAFVEGV